MSPMLREDPPPRQQPYCAAVLGHEALLDMPHDPVGRRQRQEDLLLLVAPYDAFVIGVLLTPEYLFRGAVDSIEEDSPLIARPVNALKSGEEADLFVSDFGWAVGATSDYVIIRMDWNQEERLQRKLFAKSTRELGETSLDSLKLVAGYKERTHVFRPAAVSERYLVWQDREPGKTDTWKIYAKRTDELLVPGAEFLVMDTNILLEGPSIRKIHARLSGKRRHAPLAGRRVDY